MNWNTIVHCLHTFVAFYWNSLSKSNYILLARTSSQDPNHKILILTFCCLKYIFLEVGKKFPRIMLYQLTFCWWNDEMIFWEKVELWYEKSSKSIIVPILILYRKKIIDSAKDTFWAKIKKWRPLLWLSNAEIFIFWMKKNGLVPSSDLYFVRQNFILSISLNLFKKIKNNENKTSKFR